jgi:hypothetical protein
MRKQRSGSSSQKKPGRGRLGIDIERPHRDVDIARVMRADSADAFIRNPDDGDMNVEDDLAESLAEEFVHSATSGENQAEETLDQVVPEEIGGPFIETSAEEEFADDVDESNPTDAEPEPMPRAVTGLSARPRRE